MVWLKFAIACFGGGFDPQTFLLPSNALDVFVLTSKSCFWTTRR